MRSSCRWRMRTRPKWVTQQRRHGDIRRLGLRLQRGILLVADAKLHAAAAHAALCRTIRGRGSHDAPRSSRGGSRGAEAPWQGPRRPSRSVRTRGSLVPGVPIWLRVYGFTLNGATFSRIGGYFRPPIRGGGTPPDKRASRHKIQEFGERARRDYTGGMHPRKPRSTPATSAATQAGRQCGATASAITSTTGPSSR